MSAEIEKTLNKKKAELKTLQDKYDLNNVRCLLIQKKIKLLRKENEELKKNS